MTTMDVSSDALSEVTYEHQCTAGCFKKNLVRKAVKACSDCKKYFCPVCLAAHDSLLDNHNIVEPSVLSAPQPPPLPTEECKKHVGKTIDIWCVQHDEVCCVSCILFDHRACEHIKDISSEILEIYKQEEFDRVKNELEDNLEYLKSRKICLNGEKENLSASKNKQISNIKEHTHRIILMIQKLGETAKDDLNAKFKEIEDKIKRLAEDCRTFEEKISKCLEQFHSCIDNKPQLFINMKNAQRTLALFYTKCREPVGVGSVVFTPDCNIEQFLSGMRYLGTINNVTHRYELKQKQEMNVKMNDDSDDCDIGGSCFLPDGSIVVADSRNSKLKHVDISSLSVIESCLVTGSPYGVCLIGQQVLAVALLEKKIQFVTLETGMKISRTLGVDHDCYGITYFKGEMYVSDSGNTIYVYNMQGSLLRKLTNITSSTCRYLAINKDREKLYSACSHGGLHCTDRDGRSIYTYRDPKMKLCHGVCLDKRSSMFVCGYFSHNVVQLCDDGREVGEILNRSDGVFYPQSLCYDPSRQKIVVTQMSNTVLVCQLEPVSND